MKPHHVFERHWSMPAKFTFEMAVVQNIINKYMQDSKGWVDPFAGENSPAEVTNDINEDRPTEHHLDAVEFLKTFEDQSVNGVLLDPPYSMHQVLISYSGYGGKRINSLTPVYNEVKRILKPNGLAICFGWNSNGIGKKRKFELMDVYLIAHGAHHNDTIITVEKKIPQTEMF